MSLSATVRNMDQYAQGALSQIAAIADLSLLSLETPEGIRDTENIAAALTAIWETATNMRDLINGQASDVGCSYHDSALRRRQAAKSTFRQQEAEHA